MLRIMFFVRGKGKIQPATSKKHIGHITKEIGQLL